MPKMRRCSRRSRVGSCQVPSNQALKLFENSFGVAYLPELLPILLDAADNM